MTVQEIGSYIRFGFKPIIFVINNNGYSIERAINGPEQTYNDVSMLWDHQKMLEFFGARKETGIASKSFACKTVEELEAVLNDEAFNRADYIQVSPSQARVFCDADTFQVCEVFMDRLDYPWRLYTQVNVTRAKNAKAAAALKAAQ